MAAELERLRIHGYGYVADVRWPGTSRANVDFLLFGPSGAYVIDAKNWSAAVSVRHGVLRAGRYRKDAEVDKVQRMARDLDASLGVPLGTFRSVICFAAQPDLRLAQCGSTYVLGIGSLVAWLAQPTDGWEQQRIAAIADWLPTVLASAVPGRQISVLRPTERHEPARSPGDPSTPQVWARQPLADAGRHRRAEAGLYGHLR